MTDAQNLKNLENKRKTELIGTIKDISRNYLEQDEFETVMICAIRYCYGRQTYMPSLITEIATKKLSNFTDKMLSVLHRDLGYNIKTDGTEKVEACWLDFMDAVNEEINKRGIIV